MAPQIAFRRFGGPVFAPVGQAQHIVDAKDVAGVGFAFQQFAAYGVFDQLFHHRDRQTEVGGQIHFRFRRPDIQGFQHQIE